MGVQQQLGLEDDGLLVHQIRDRWRAWSIEDQRLAAVPDFDTFRGWLRAACFNDRDLVLHALASRASTDAGDDHFAGAALAWALLPGAATLANRLTRKSNDVEGSRIDSLVAGQLWLEARTFPWRMRRDRIAAKILADTRAGTLLDLGALTQLRRNDRTWYNTRLLFGGLLEGEWNRCGEPLDGPDLKDRLSLGSRTRERLTVEFADGPDVTPESEVASLLGWGVRQEVISDRDRLILIELIAEAEISPPARTFGNGGLGGREATSRVGQRLGVSPATIRRHLAASVTALAAARGRYVA